MSWALTFLLILPELHAGKNSAVDEFLRSEGRTIRISMTGSVGLAFLVLQAVAPDPMEI